LLFGLIAIVQVAFLPGFIVLQLLNIRGFFLKCILAFAFSLALNYQLVFILTATGFYTRGEMTGVLVAELLASGWLFARQHSLSDRINLALFQGNSTGQRFFFRIANYFFLIAAFCSLLVMLLTLLKENPGVFHTGDDVMSWNRWAVEWFNGRFPSGSGEYPQLLPANWSTTYLLTRTADVQMFAKAVMAVFPVAVLFVFYDAYRRFFSLGALAGSVFCAYLFLQLLGPLGSGYADIPVAFFALLTFYLIYLHNRNVLGLRDTLVSVAITASGAALTKQAGFFVLVIAILLLLLTVVKKRALHVQCHDFLPLMYVILAVSLLVIPWYAFKENQIRKGIDPSNVGYVTSGIYAEKNPLKRVLTATLDVEKRTGVPRAFWVVFVVLLVISLKTQIGRRSLFVGLPYYLIWAAFFSYDNRNMALSLPFLSIAAGEGFCFVLGLINHSGSEGRTFSRHLTLDAPLGVSLGVLLSFIVTLALLGSAKYPSSVLIAKSNEIRRKVGDPIINQKLYEFYYSTGFKGKVVSIYPEMCVLPQIGQYCYMGRFKSADQGVQEVERCTDICALLKLVTDSEEIRYIIIPDGLYPALFENSLKKGTLFRIFGASGMSFFEIRCHFDHTKEK
jgi:hypothetical protein